MGHVFTSQLPRIMAKCCGVSLCRSLVARRRAKAVMATWWEQSEDTGDLDVETSLEAGNMFSRILCQACQWPQKYSAAEIPIFQQCQSSKNVRLQDQDNSILGYLAMKILSSHLVLMQSEFAADQRRSQWGRKVSPEGTVLVRRPSLSDRPRSLRYRPCHLKEPGRGPKLINDYWTQVSLLLE